MNSSTLEHHFEGELTEEKDESGVLILEDDSSTCIETSAVVAPDEKRNRECPETSAAPDESLEERYTDENRKEVITPLKAESRDLRWEQPSKVEERKRNADMRLLCTSEDKEFENSEDATSYTTPAAKVLRMNENAPLTESQSNSEGNNGRGVSAEVKAEAMDVLSQVSGPPGEFEDQGLMWEGEDMDSMSDPDCISENSASGTQHNHTGESVPSYTTNKASKQTNSVTIWPNPKPYEINDLHAGGSVTLWQFLLELLISGQHKDLLQWTNHEGEFVLLKAEEVAHLWGLRKNKNHRMNYDKLSRALRYYYQKNIIQKVHGNKFVYRFVYLPEAGLKSFQAAMDLKHDNEGAVISHVREESKVEQQADIFSMVKQEVASLQVSHSCGDNVTSGVTSPSLTGLLQKRPTVKPCCSCQCHSTEPTPTPPIPPPTHPHPSSPIVDQKIHNIQPPLRGGSESVVHVKRHAINMQRLAEQIRMQVLHPDVKCEGSDPSPTTKPHVEPVSVAEQRRTSSGPNHSIRPPFVPPTDGAPVSPMRFQSPPGYPDMGTFPGPYPNSGQPCVWMPVPVAMLSRWWQSLAASGLDGQTPSTRNS